MKRHPLDITGQPVGFGLLDLAAASTAHQLGDRDRPRVSLRRDEAHLFPGLPRPSLSGVVKLTEGAPR